MALTIQQIQDQIDSKVDDPRQLINLIADYLQANPSSPGGGGIESDTQYASNADAVAALGTNKLYLSTTLINGSPIVLRTTPTVDASYDSNADAVAAIGIGVLYNSTTLLNGSPIVLVTI